MKDYYAILGVVYSAEDVVIRAAWKALAQRYHPDRCEGGKAEANAKMVEINEAYSVLSDPIKRKAYDDSRGAKERDFGDWVHEEADQAANSFDPLDRDWQIAVGFYPDLEIINKRLSKISKFLAFTFRASLLESKAFEKRKELARFVEQLFLESYFGTNPAIIDFARELIYQGNKAAAKALNESIRVLGGNVPADRVISKVCKEFKIETEEMRKQRLWREANAKQDEQNKARAKAEAEAEDKQRAFLLNKELMEKYRMGWALTKEEAEFIDSIGNAKFNKELMRRAAKQRTLPMTIRKWPNAAQEFTVVIGAFLSLISLAGGWFVFMITVTLTVIIYLGFRRR
jgi:curved DNA-binding protein CbpA